MGGLRLAPSHTRSVPQDIAPCTVIHTPCRCLRVPRTPLNPCRALCNTAPCFNRQFISATHTFHATSTSPIPRCSPFPFGMKIIVAHASSAGGVPSLNVRCTNLTKTPHCLFTGYFLRVASRSYPFKSSAHIPGGPPNLPPFSPFTAVSTSVSLGIPPSMSDCCTEIGTLSPSGGLHL